MGEIAVSKNSHGAYIDTRLGTTVAQSFHPDIIRLQLWWPIAIQCKNAIDVGIDQTQRDWS